MDSHFGFIVIHLIGLAFGMGGVTVVHVYLHQMIHQPDQARTYARLLPSFSLLIWFGVYLLGMSGIGLFLEQPEVYATSGKFLAKMAIVAVLLTSGLYLNGPVIRNVLTLEERDWSQRTERFYHAVKAAIPGGVVSLVSWYAAMILGAVGPKDWTVGQVLSVYLYVICIGILGGFLVRDMLIHGTGGATNRDSGAAGRTSPNLR